MKPHFITWRGAPLIAVTLMLGACGSESAFEPEQKSVCVTTSIEASVNTDLCAVGQKIAFMPQHVENEDTALIFVAANCDAGETFNFTKGGAICVFNPTRPINGRTDKPQPQTDRE